MSGRTERICTADTEHSTIERKRWGARVFDRRFLASRFTNHAPRLFASLLSGAMYALAFPPYHQAWLAWVALVSLLLVACRSSIWGAFGHGYLAGVVAFGWTLEWIRHVTVSGWIILSFYLALYPAIWAAAVAWIQTRRTSHVAGRASFENPDPRLETRDSRPTSRVSFSVDGGRWTVDVLLLLAVPAAWALLEWIRSWLFSGFGWALLSYSQWHALPAIQIAHLVTAYGVSFLIVLVNVAIAEVFLLFVARRLPPDWRLVASPQSYRRGQTPSAPDPIGATKQSSFRTPGVLLVASVVLVLSLSYGYWRLQQPIEGQPVTVAVLQGNVPQHQKWDERYAQQILDQYMVLTRVVADDQSDLVIWPETSVPGYLEEEPGLLDAVQGAARLSGSYLLVGTPSMQLEETEREATLDMVSRRSELRYYNSAVLLGPDGTLLQRHHKMHLVPFGEYVPFEDRLPVLRAWIPPTGDFSPGRDCTVFQLRTQASSYKLQATRFETRDADRKQSTNSQEQQRGESELSVSGSGYDAGHLQLEAGSLQLKFGVLICYEDIFPRIVRRLRRSGADFLVNITNDAWFGDRSGAAEQHAQASLFRAVEEGVWVVRSANTGYSCVIDPCGRIVDEVKDRDGRRVGVPGYAIATLRVAPR